MTVVTVQQGIPSAQAEVRPMNFGRSMIYFGIPTLALMLGFHTIQPALLRGGAVPFYAYLAGVLPTLFLMLAASLMGLWTEGRPINASTLASRFRFRRMSGRDWLWTLGLLVVMFLAMGLVEAINGFVLETGMIPMPGWLPDFLLPASEQATGTNDLFAIYERTFGGLRGNWLALISYWVLIIVNVVGEELWWRGYVLPRQELAFGSKTWLVHGLMWWAFHLFKWWALLPLLPVTLLLSFLAQRTQNSWPGLICHFVINGLGLIPITLAILGVL